MKTAYLACLAPLCFSAQAWSQYAAPVVPVSPPAAADCVELEVYSQAGRLPNLFSETSAQRWVALSEGDALSVKVINKCAQDFHAALYVDGLNVIDGQSASISQKTVVSLPGFSSRLFQGWRTALDKEARFEVAPSAQQAYRTRRGFSSIEGNFELAVFEKQPKTLFYAIPATATGSPSPPLPGTDSGPAKGSVGSPDTLPPGTPSVNPTYPAPSRPQYPRGRVPADYGLPSSLKKVSQLQFGQVHLTQSPAEGLMNRIAQGPELYSAAQSSEFSSISSPPALVLRVNYGLAFSLQARGIVHTVPPLSPAPQFSPKP